MKALNAVSGEVGARTLKEAVNKHVGPRGVSRLREIRNEIRNEMGGNIVKGPKADELKRRLQAEGLLPNGKAKSVPPDLEEKLAKLDAGKLFEKQLVEKPDPLYGAWETEQLKKFRAGVKENDPKYEGMRKQIDAELARREKVTKPPEENDIQAKVRAAKERGQKQAEEQMAKEPDYLKDWKVNQLQDKRQAAWAMGRDDLVQKIDEDLAKLGVKADEPLKGSAKTIAAIQSARAFDKQMAKEQLRRDGDQTFDQWDETTGTGAKKLGQGSYGTVMKSKDGTYAVKRGDISDTEAKLIQKLGDADLGPKLIAADVDGPGYNGAPGVNNRRGRIAMSVVPGSPIGTKKPDKEIGGVKVADAYWKARADLHRMGIAHNDMHIDNVLIDRKGKGRFVDMGLAQDNPKAAFAEAMGAFEKPRGAMVTRAAGVQGQGDWQVRRWDGTAGRLLSAAHGNEPSRRELERRAPIAARVLDNKNALQFRMQKDGYSKDDIATIMDHGLRNDPSTYSQGVWQRVSDDQAREYINILYDGV